MKGFIPTFFNVLKLTYHNNHSSLKEAQGGIHGKLLSHDSSELSLYGRGFECRLYLHLWLAVFPTVCIWFAALGVSTMAFNLNGFNFNHLVLNTSGCPMLIYADIINQPNLGTQSMHSPNANHFPLLLAMNDRSPPEWIPENAFPDASLGFYEPIAGELWPQQAIANESPLMSEIVCDRRSETFSSSTRPTGMQKHS